MSEDRPTVIWCAKCGVDHLTVADCKSEEGSLAPAWYSADEMRHHLIRNSYAPEIADELCVNYAANLQAAFVKGYEIGKREKQINPTATK